MTPRTLAVRRACDRLRAARDITIDAIVAVTVEDDEQRDADEEKIDELLRDVERRITEALRRRGAA